MNTTDKGLKKNCIDTWFDLKKETNEDELSEKMRSVERWHPTSYSNVPYCVLHSIVLGPSSSALQKPYLY